MRLNSVPSPEVKLVCVELTTLPVKRTPAAESFDDNWPKHSSGRGSGPEQSVLVRCCQWPVLHLERWSAMNPPNTNPYPGFDSTGQYYTPRKAPRVKPEAEEIACRHAGTINLFNSEQIMYNDIAPPPSPRCRTNEARENYEKSRKGLVGELLGVEGPKPAPEAVPQPRVKPEAESIATRHRGGNMCQLISRNPQHPQSARPAPRVKVDAVENAELDRGLRMSLLMHDAKSLPSTPRPAPRIKPEAEGSASLGAGSQMAKIMFKYGTTPRSSRAVPRVKSEALQNYTLDHGKRMEQLFFSYGQQPQSVRPVPRVRDGHSNAKLDQGGRLSRLMHEGDKLLGDAKPPPRVASAFGRQILRQSQQGSMSEIFSEESKWQMVPTAGPNSAKAY